MGGFLMAVSFEESFARKRIDFFSVGTVLQYLRYILFLLAAALFLCGYLSGLFNVILCLSLIHISEPTRPY